VGAGLVIKDLSFCARNAKPVIKAYTTKKSNII
jgi:hypothetical protein